jgi:hypothetical protein
MRNLSSSLFRSGFSDSSLKALCYFETLIEHCSGTAWMNGANGLKTSLFLAMGLVGFYYTNTLGAIGFAFVLFCHILAISSSASIKNCSFF